MSTEAVLETAQSEPRITVRTASRGAAAQHLAAELEWVRVLLNVHTRRMQREGLLPGANAPGPEPVVVPEEVGARLSRPRNDLFRPRGGLTDEEQHALDLAEAYREKTRADLTDHHGLLPLVALRERCELDDTDYLLLLLALANELGGDFPRIFAFLNNNPNRPWPTLAMAMDCLAAPDQWVDFRARLDPRAPLLRYRLLDWQRDYVEPSGSQRPLIPSGRVQRWVSGDVTFDHDLRAFGKLLRVNEGPPELLVPESDRETFQRLDRFVDRLHGQTRPFPLIVLRGPEGAGRHAWTHATASRLGLATLAVNLSALSSHRGSLEEGLAVALREARLQRALLCLENWEELVEPQLPMIDEDGGMAPTVDPAARASVALQRAMLEHPDPLVLLLSPSAQRLPKIACGMQFFDLSMPDRAMAAELWRRHLLEVAPPGSGLDAEQLASTYSLTPGQIALVSREALRSAQLRDDHQLTQEILNEAVKEHIRHRLGEHARYVKPRYRWNDLIVHDEVTIQLREMVSRYHNHHKVLSEWGYGERFGEHLGISALFEGPPGTGKTMAASIVADELGLDLYQVNLSRVVSKYIGETEKNLARIFDESERAHVMLLFDEADSLFTKRTKVKSSTDRYANLEVNYLLQRIEVFSGICVLTSNAADNMDTAFARRLTLRVRFDEPDQRQREQLWRTMLAGRQMIGDDIDIEALAEEFKITGGLIRNAVLRAAFIAAAHGRPIDHDLLWVAVRVEMRQQGLLVSGSPVGEMAELLSERVNWRE